MIILSTNTPQGGKYPGSGILPTPPDGKECVNHAPWRREVVNKKDT